MCSAAVFLAAHCRFTQHHGPAASKQESSSRWNIITTPTSPGHQHKGSSSVAPCDGKAVRRCHRSEVTSDYSTSIARRHQASTTRPWNWKFLSGARRLEAPTKTHCSLDELLSPKHAPTVHTPRGHGSLMNYIKQQADRVLSQMTVPQTTCLGSSPLQHGLDAYQAPESCADSSSGTPHMHDPSAGGNRRHVRGYGEWGLDCLTAVLANKQLYEWLQVARQGSLHRTMLACEGLAINFLYDHGRSTEKVRCGTYGILVNCYSHSARKYQNIRIVQVAQSVQVLVVACNTPVEHVACWSTVETVNQPVLFMFHSPSQQSTHC